MTAKVIMVQGTSSSAGKSLLVTALCRIYARRGVRVAPFKAQNMSNNAGVCADGSEIGRAQMTQAWAAGIAPKATMNPILLKPESNMRSQVIVMGRPFETLPARSYYQQKQMLWGTVTQAIDQLREEYELIIAEGAGSPVELNLKQNDIVNMAVARYTNADVLLVGDIDRGGIFPQLLGTLWLLPPEEQALIRGFVVNKFRGDPALFTEGVQILEERSGKPVLGVVPWVADLHLPEEDGVSLDQLAAQTAVTQPGSVEIAVIQFPRIANFDDFDPLLHEPGVKLRFVREVAALGQPQAIILPGTKSTMADLAWLRERGLAQRICELAAEGTAVVGICGGYQMLGTDIYDPDQVEGAQAQVPGLGLLPVQTTFVAPKTTYQATARISCEDGWLASLAGTTVSGYEIHMGRTVGPSSWLTIKQRGETAVHVPDGAISTDQRIWGCYLHGLFANAGWRRAWLKQVGHLAAGANEPENPMFASLERLADMVESILQIDNLPL